MAPAAATVLVLCAPVQTGDVTTSGKITVADAASLVLVVWCLVGLLRGRGGRLTPRAALVLGAPAVAFAVATAASADPSASLPGFARYLQIFVLVPAAVLLLMRDARDFRFVCGALVLLALVQGAVGVVQNLTGTGASYMGQDIRAVGTFGALDVMGMSTVGALVPDGHRLTGVRRPRRTGLRGSWRAVRPPRGPGCVRPPRGRRGTPCRAWS
ncbi:MAG TPA: hypothetical protein VNS49_14850, partial [Streptomyces sp.]|nr:hypothetical protein [Streptomyces sp.]